MKSALRAIGSFHLSVGIFGLLTLITWLGTISQESIGLFQSQRLYFESWFVTRSFGEWTVPFLPGGMLLLTALAVNLLVGGLVQLAPRVRARARGRARTARLLSGVGILVTHVGILALLGACFAKYVLAEEGGLRLYEGDSSDVFVSYHDWEIVVAEVAGGEVVRENVVPHEVFADRTGDRAATIRGDGLPFRLVVAEFAPNSEVRRAPGGSGIDGFRLQPIALHKQGERNVAGCTVRAVGRGGDTLAEGILWGLARYPLTVEAGGRSFALTLRKARMPMPFRIHLDRFVHEVHPNTRIPRKFLSDVTVVTGDGLESHRIRMNEPLRRDGLIVFQSSWGPQDATPGTALYSDLTVVRNPADPWPWYTLYAIAFGMLLHFGAQLVRFVLERAAELRGGTS